MFNSTISIVRVLSMLIILVSHVLTWKNINCLQIPSVGVAAFLFISGYLYGTKNLEHKFTWFVGRVERVLVPFWVLSITLSIYLLLRNEYLFALKNFLETLFNLQGFHAVFHFPVKLGYYHISGLSHCWFLTIIMACYLIVSILKGSKIERFVDNNPLLGLFFFVGLHILFTFVNVAIGTFVIFFIGYFFSRFNAKKDLLRPKFIVLIVFLSILTFAIRIILKHYIDDCPIYNLFVAPFASNFCAVSFFAVVNSVAKYNFVTNLVRKKIWRIIDQMTYPVYLTHYMFLKEPFEIAFSKNVFLQIIMFIIFSLVSAYILKICTSKIVFFNKK